MGETLLTVQGVSKQFGRHQALDSIDLEVRAGEIFTLLGPSGCGKTTTLRLIAGLEWPDAGTLSFDDRIIASAAPRLFVPPHKRGMGMVFQSYAIWPHMTVFDNVAYPLRVRRHDRRDTRTRVMAALDLVGLADLAERRGPDLSGGQQQRVAIARALVFEPKMLLLDEPFSNLDAKLRENTRVQLKLLLRQLEMTTVFVTHDQDEALSISDRIAVLNRGRVDQVGTAQELYERPATAFVRDFLGRTILLDGCVGETVTGGMVAVRLTRSTGTLLASSSGHATAGPGTDVVLSVRPEDVRVGRVADGSARGHGLDARVEAALFLGDRWEYRVRCGDEAFTVYTSRGDRLGEGDDIRLEMDPGSIRVWPR